MGRKKAENTGVIVPVAYSEELVDKIIARIKDGAHPVVAARAEGVSKIQWSTWTNPAQHVNAGLIAAVDRAEAECECSLIETVRIDEKRWRSALSLLERRFAERWTVNLNATTDQPLQLVVRLANDRITLDANATTE